MRDETQKRSAQDYAAVMRYLNIRSSTVIPIESSIKHATKHEPDLFDICCQAPLISIT